MKVVITGGGGFLGKKLARRILQQGTIAGVDGKPEKVSELLLFDVGKASGPGLRPPRLDQSRGGPASGQFCAVCGGGCHEAFAAR